MNLIKRNKRGFTTGKIIEELMDDYDLGVLLNAKQQKVFISICLKEARIRRGINKIVLCKIFIEAKRNINFHNYLIGGNYMSGLVIMSICIPVRLLFLYVIIRHAKIG